MELAITSLSYIVEIMHYFLWIVYLFCIPKAIHIFQQENYQLRDYIRWIYKNPKQAFMAGFKQLTICISYFICIVLIDILVIKLNLALEQKGLIYLLQIFLLYVIFYTANIRNIIKWKNERKVAKKKLVYTARVKRLIFFVFIALVLIMASFRQELTYESSIELICYEQYIKQILLYSFLIFTMPIVLILGAIFAIPTEMLISDHYISSARLKILRPKYKNLIRIGITGSYGKTSTKFILKTILSEKYNVLATPESYNTTMGNVKVIRNELKPEHEVFISEMGARYRGDIRKICEFVYPQIALVTSIGPQHLESFKTIENVAKTKAELIKAIPKKNEVNLTNMYSSNNKNTEETKCAIFLPNDNSFCKEIYEKENERNKFLYAINDKNADVYAKDIKMSKDGCEFTAVTSIGDIQCKSKLLGELNIQNILGAISIAIYLKLTKEQISRGVSKIEPIEHRLQIIPSTNGNIVIDDAFNSNPEGSKMALDVLKTFEGRKIIITPGMVELGEKENELNKEFGRHMAECVDIAILVGVKRSKPIEEGLHDKGFNDMNIYVVSNLDEATKKLASITQQGDVVLFENDLPDSYELS